MHHSYDLKSSNFASLKLPSISGEEVRGGHNPFTDLFLFLSFSVFFALLKANVSSLGVEFLDKTAER